MNLVFTNKEELVRDVKVGGRLGCSVHEMVEFRVLRGGNKAKIRTATIDFRRVELGLSRNLLEGIPWETALEKSPGELADIQGSPPPSSRQPILTTRKTDKADRTPAWMKKALLTRLRRKKEEFKRWKQGWMTWKEYKHCPSMQRWV